MRNRKNQNELFGQNVRKSIFGSKQKLKTKTILLAVSGDTEALMEVVDETVKRSLEVGLIAAIMKFHPYI